MDEPIRSHLPNENYRRGWDETFRGNLRRPKLEDIPPHLRMEHDGRHVGCLECEKLVRDSKAGRPLAG